MNSAARIADVVVGKCGHVAQPGSQADELSHGNLIGNHGAIGIGGEIVVAGFGDSGAVGG